MGSKKTTTTTTRDVPQYVEDASRQAVNLGTKIASRPYEGYQGERVAPLSANEQAGLNLASSTTGQTQGLIDRGVQNLSQIKSFPDSDIRAYENPYTQGVMDSQIRDINAASGQAERQMSTNLAGGSSGAILGRSALQKNQIGAIADTTAKGRSEAFGQAMKAWSTDNDMRVRAADAWRSTAGNVQAMNSQQLRDFMLTGGAARAVSQMKKDFDYQKFTEARDWDVNNLGPLLASLQAPHDSDEKTVTKKSGGVLGQVIGGVALVAGAILAPYTGGASLAAGSAVANATK